MALASPCRRTPKTIASSTHCIRLASRPASIGDLVSRKLEPHLAVAVRVVTPGLAHLDEQEQVHRLLGHLGDLTTGIRADRLDGLPSAAQDDLALTFALDIDGLLDPHRAVLELLPGAGLDHRLIWQFLVEPQIELLARDFGRQLSQWCV